MAQICKTSRAYQLAVANKCTHCLEFYYTVVAKYTATTALAHAMNQQKDTSPLTFTSTALSK